MLQQSALEPMGFLLDRIRLVRTLAAERAHGGLSGAVGPVHKEVVFLVDGVGGFQAGAVMVRRAIRLEEIEMGSILFDWQTPIYGEVLFDLIWLRRNRVMGARLAQRLLAFRREHPGTPIHVVAFSGGAGIAAFGLEGLRGRRIVETAVWACPALSPKYDFADALRAVKRGYLLVSHRDRVVLGLGTRVFGTTDRRFQASGGMVGFRRPAGLAGEGADAYETLREIRWTPTLRTLGHSGGHHGWTSVPLLREHLLPLLRGNPLLPTHPIPAA